MLAANLPYAAEVLGQQQSHARVFEILSQRF